MSLIDFVKAAGRAIGIGSAEAAPSADDLKKEAQSHGLDVSKLDVAVEGDKVTVSGPAATQEQKEKIILAMGNVAGVAKVEAKSSQHSLPTLPSSIPSRRATPSPRSQRHSTATPTSIRRSSKRTSRC